MKKATSLVVWLLVLAPALFTFWGAYQEGNLAVEEAQGAGLFVEEGRTILPLEERAAARVQFLLARADAFGEEFLNGLLASALLALGLGLFLLARHRTVNLGCILLVAGLLQLRTTQQAVNLETELRAMSLVVQYNVGEAAVEAGAVQWSSTRERAEFFWQRMASQIWGAGSQQMFWYFISLVGWVLGLMVAMGGGLACHVVVYLSSPEEPSSTP